MRQLSGITLFAFVLTCGILITTNVDASPPIFSQQHLRNSRNTSTEHGIAAQRALGKLATRLSGKKDIKLAPPVARETITRPEDISELIKMEPGQNSLAQAIAIKNRFTGQNLPLDIFIARCYWATGQINRAKDLSNSLLKQIENPMLHHFLFLEALQNSSPELARYHLDRTDLSEKEKILYRTRLFFQQSGALGPLAILLFSAAVLFVSLRQLLKRRELLLSAWKNISDKIARLQQNLHQNFQINLAKSRTHFRHFVEALTREKTTPGNQSVENETHQPLTTSGNERIQPLTSITKQTQTNIEVPSNLTFDNQLGFVDPELARLFFLAMQLKLCEKMLRVICLTSESPLTNRGLAALQLARQFAAEDYHTLLIDANNAGGFIHETLECEPTPGLSDLIDPECCFSTIFRKTPQPQLSLITCGSQPSGFADLNLPAWELLLDYCRKNFEIIVIALPAAGHLCERVSFIQEFGVILLEDNSGDEEEKQSTDFFKSRETITILGTVKPFLHELIMERRCI